MRKSLILCCLAILSFGVSPSCSGLVPATVTLSPQIPIKKGATIFLLARVQRKQIVTSLQSVGFVVADELAEGSYVLTVTVGRSRGGPRKDCGTVNNVAYVLNDVSQRLMVIKGRGRTGACTPNIFEEMSQVLANHSSDG